MALKAAHNLAFALGGVFLGATAPLASAGAQTTSPPPQNQSSYATPFAGQVTSAAKQADVWYNNYLFRRFYQSCGFTMSRSGRRIVTRRAR
jgi:hypothetical protein